MPWRRCEDARGQNGVLIVARVDRLTRCAKDVPIIFSYGVPIHVCDLGGRINRQECRKLARRAEQEARAKSVSQRLAHSGKRSTNQSASPATPDGRRRGLVSAGVRRDDNIRRVVDLALREPEFRRLTMRQRVVRLNAEGVRYVRTVRIPAGEAWTVDRLTKQWRRVLDEIALQSEEDAGAFLP